MNKGLRLVLLGVVGLAGVLSMVATSPPPPSFNFVVHTSNTDGYPYTQTYACRNEVIQLAWSSYDAASAVLTVEPVGGITPNFERRTLSGSGQLEVTLLQEVTFSLDEGEYSLNYDVLLLPDTLCTDFPIPVIGYYEGELVQSAPNVSTLPRSLGLYWEGGVLNAVLTTPPDATTYQAEWLTCAFDAEADWLDCTRYDGGELAASFRGGVTAAGWQGNYETVAETSTSRTPVSGTFSFSPAERPEPETP